MWYWDHAHLEAGCHRIPRIRNLVSKHSALSTSFPICLFTQREDEVPVPEEGRKPDPEPEKTGGAGEKADEDETVVEGATEEKGEKEKPVPTKWVIVNEWVQLNSPAPLWTR